MHVSSASKIGLRSRWSSAFGLNIFSQILCNLDLYVAHVSAMYKCVNNTCTKPAPQATVISWSLVRRRFVTNLLTPSICVTHRIKT